MQRENIGGSSREGKVKTVDNWFAVQEKPKEKDFSSSAKTLVVVGTYSIGKERIVKGESRVVRVLVLMDLNLHCSYCKDIADKGVLRC